MLKKLFKVLLRETGMASSKHKAKVKPKAKPAARAKSAKKPARKPAPKKVAAKARKPAQRPKAPAKAAKPPKPAPAPSAKGGAPKAAVPAKASAALPAKPGKPGDHAHKPGASKPATSGKKSSRKGPATLRRASDGEPFNPGDVLLPGGLATMEEVQYLFRGCAAAERPAVEAGVEEVMTRSRVAEMSLEPDARRIELRRHADVLAMRFDKGSIEPLLPSRAQTSRRALFVDVVERARGRRREIGAFLRGLDLGRTETSHMDSHGEASLQSLMEWAARLENLAEADEPERADFAQLHRGLDQLESKTEELIVDVELTLRRLRDRLKSTH
jgi:hypothetical protein